MKNNSTLNSEVIAEIRTLDDSGKFLEELVGIFFNTAPNQMHLIRNAIATKNFSLVVGLAHQLKSSSGNLGATNFSMLAASLEGYSDWSNLDALEKLVSKMDEELSLVRAALEKECLKAA